LLSLTADFVAIGGQAPKTFVVTKLVVRFDGGVTKSDALLRLGLAPLLGEPTGLSPLPFVSSGLILLFQRVPPVPFRLSPRPNTVVSVQLPTLGDRQSPDSVSIRD
jgi:hypothetical protein